MMGAYVIGGIMAFLGMIVSGRLKSKFRKYSQIPLQNGMSGKEIAEKMLHDNGIYDVTVTSVGGMLTDHYNPRDKTVNLSEGVYNERTVASAAVAAHECGHAVQHANAYPFLKMRSALVPVVTIGSKWSMWVIMAGIALVNTFPTLLLAGIILFAGTTLFSLITLPVEFDASNRALAWMEESGVVSAGEHHGAKDALKWAAMTYVVAALGSLATLIYYLSIYLGRRD